MGMIEPKKNEMVFNPKRLVTFYSRLINLLEKELIQAKYKRESDYYAWIVNKLDKQKQLKINKIKQIKQRL